MGYFGDQVFILEVKKNGSHQVEVYKGQLVVWHLKLNNSAALYKLIGMPHHARPCGTGVGKQIHLVKNKQISSFIKKQIDKQTKRQTETDRQGNKFIIKLLSRAALYKLIGMSTMLGSVKLNVGNNSVLLKKKTWLISE